MLLQYLFSSLIKSLRAILKHIQNYNHANSWKVIPIQMAKYKTCIHSQKTSLFVSLADLKEIFRNDLQEKTTDRDTCDI